MYLSKYSPEENYITAAQYITELICEKRALFLKRELPYRFWLHKEWEKFFKQQIPAAVKLLKKYHEADIIKALRESYKIYSLRNPLLIKLIEQKQLERMNKPAVELVENQENISEPSKPFGVKSLLGKLRN